MFDDYVEQLKEKFSEKNIMKSVHSLIQWSINNLFTIISAIIIICIESILCFHILSFESIEASIALFIGILSVTTSVYINYFTNILNKHNISFSIDHPNRLKVLTQLHKDFKQNTWNQDNIRKFARIIKLDRENPEVFYTLFPQSKEKYLNIKEELRNFCYDDQDIFRQKMQVWDSEHENPKFIPNPHYDHSNFMFKHFIRQLYDENFDEYGNSEPMPLVDTEKLHEEDISFQDHGIPLYEPYILDYIISIPPNPDGTFKTKNQFQKLYSNFLNDITDLKKTFDKEFKSVWNEFVYSH